LVLFDVPLAQNGQRSRLRRSLRDRGFGCLQGSVWITPDSLQQERQTLAGTQSNPASLILFEGRPSGNETDHELVAAAWDFDEINAGYARDLSLLDQFPIISLNEHKGRAALQQWARMESAAWLSAVAADPLLPQELLPSSYLGKKTWRKRVETLARAGQQLQEFRL
jgi:phenylacetic acid degradation operon negative regulatory protein